MRLAIGHSFLIWRQRRRRWRTTLTTHLHMGARSAPELTAYLFRQAAGKLLVRLQIHAPLLCLGHARRRHAGGFEERLVAAARGLDSFSLLIETLGTKWLSHRHGTPPIIQGRNAAAGATFQRTVSNCAHELRPRGAGGFRRPEVDRRCCKSECSVWIRAYAGMTEDHGGSPRG